MRETVPRIPDGACPVCRQQMSLGACRNGLCNSDTRSISSCDAIGYLDNAWKVAIHRFKYGGHWGWGPIFGRVVYEHILGRNLFTDYDLLVVNPTWASEPRPTRCRIEAVAMHARMLTVPNVLNVDPLLTDPTIVKTAETGKSTGTGLDNKRQIGRDLYDVLEVRRPDRVAGKVVLVLDDVWTTGSQLDAVARRLSEAGARRVEGLVLARAPWR